MSQAADLLAQGLAAHAAQFPGDAVTINDHAYPTGFARSALKRQQDLISGGWLKDYTISFWGLAQLFVTATQRLPQEGDPVLWDDLALKVSTVTLDPTGRTVTMLCQGRAK